MTRASDFALVILALVVGGSCHVVNEGEHTGRTPGRTLYGPAKRQGRSRTTVLGTR